MKNKLLTLLTVTMLTGSLLVGCGGTETGADNGGTNNDSTVNSEADGSDVAAKVDPDSEYTETETVEEPDTPVVNDETVEETDGMSENAKAYLDKIRELAEQVNAEREGIRKDYPDADVPTIVEVESKDGLELLTNFGIRFDNADDTNNDLEIMRVFFRTDVYDKYYIEFVRETSYSVEFNFYCTKQ